MAVAHIVSHDHPDDFTQVVLYPVGAGGLGE
jgi:hypothetical protein